ncbi:hypothetical protein [Lacticaseibacillus zhaodongensis]|uniref:hypothetical protein n=1 Tax=Lacticaseibacillus zhaodongensis TaxID=2668065 RepID=UPI0012D32B7F|nr:hypothetical protein [Lacticaseibacillus zhaodongensis]
MKNSVLPMKQVVGNLGAIRDYLAAWARVTATLQRINEQSGRTMTTVCFTDEISQDVIKINVVFGGPLDVKRANARTLWNLWRSGYTFRWHDSAIGPNDYNVNHQVYCRMRG